MQRLMEKKNEFLAFGGLEHIRALRQAQLR